MRNHLAHIALVACACAEPVVPPVAKTADASEAVNLSIPASEFVVFSLGPKTA